MSTTDTTAGYGTNAPGTDYKPLSKSEIRQRADAIYKSSFGDLPDGTVYRDIWGWKAGEPVTLQKDRYEQLEASGIFDAFRTLRYQKGYSFADTLDTIAKDRLDTGDWQLPLDIIPDVFTVNPELTPAADFISRATTQDDRVHATPLTDFPSPSWDLEGESDTDAQDNLQYDTDEPTYDDLTYDVLGYGYATRVTDQMILASNNLRSAEATQEQALMRGMRIAEENQIIRGTANDANGWDGFWDLGTPAEDPIADADVTDPDDLKNYVEDLIDQAEENGAPLGSLAVFADFDAQRTLRRAYDDIQRVSPAEDLDLGFATFSMEGGVVPVFKTHALPSIESFDTGDDNDSIVVASMEAVYLGMLQETEAKPIAKLGPEERMAVDAYGTLVDESDGDHIIVGQVDAT